MVVYLFETVGAIYNFVRRKKNKTTSIDNNVIEAAKNKSPKKYTLKQQIVGFFFGAIITFTIGIGIQSAITIINVQYTYWEKTGISYPVKHEWCWNNILRAIRFRAKLGDGDGLLSQALQKIHYQLYLSAKAKIPDDDPYWIMFWKDATHVLMSEYRVSVGNEIIANLNLITTNNSKVEDYQKYYRYLLIGDLLKRINFDIKFYDKQSKINLYVKALKISQPILKFFVSNPFDRSYKEFMGFDNYPVRFISSVLIAYFKLIDLDKNQVCNLEFRNNIFIEIGEFLSSKNAKKNFFSDKDLDYLSGAYGKTLKLYNEQLINSHCNIE